MFEHVFILMSLSNDLAPAMLDLQNTDQQKGLSRIEDYFKFCVKKVYEFDLHQGTIKISIF